MASIWKYSQLFQFDIEEKFRLSLNEGETPLESFEFEGENLYLKREDKNPTGSQKDRSLAYQLSALTQEFVHKFCISSSGNAAIAAAEYFKWIIAEDKTLDIFVSENLPEYKNERLLKAVGDNPHITIHRSISPKKDCIQFSNKKGAHNLRGSTDPLAIEGFKTIGFELIEQLPDCDAIFIPTSSATTLVGIYKAYQQKRAKMPTLHAVQTTKINTIARMFDKDFLPEKTSHSSAITDIITYRKDETLTAINETNGFAWVISEKELEEAKNIFKEKGLEISYDSSLSLAGFIKAKKNGKIYENPVLLITGI